MTYRFCIVWIAILSSAVAFSKQSQFIRKKIHVEGGIFQPQFGADKTNPMVKVAPFSVDSHQVTESQFRDFLQSHQDWLKSKDSDGLIDSKFLTYWSSEKSNRSARKYYPAVFVSWFVADAFCEANGGRLPSTFEWEYIARASRTNKDGSADQELIKKIMSWYGRPNSDDALFSVYQGQPNAFGIYHLHGLVWEWTSDFNAFFAATDSRQAGDKNSDLLCGAGSIDAADRENYAAFMRFAMRGSLKARDSLSNLGFRCAYDQAA